MSTLGGIIVGRSLRLACGTARLGAPGLGGWEPQPFWASCGYLASAPLC